MDTKCIIKLTWVLSDCLTPPSCLYPKMTDDLSPGDLKDSVSSIDRYKAVGEVYLKEVINSALVFWDLRWWMGYLAGTKKRIALNTHNWKIHSGKGSHGNQVHEGSCSSNVLILYLFCKWNTGVLLGTEDRNKDMEMSASKSVWKVADDTLPSILVLIPTLKTPLARFPNDSLCLQTPK